MEKKEERKGAVGNGEKVGLGKEGKRWRESGIGENKPTSAS